jgi:predicted RNase H-like HicB family nuclease
MTETVKRPYMRHPPCAIECRCDGNQVYALIGKDYMEGCVGFGDTLADALRDLANAIEREVTVVSSETDSVLESQSGSLSPAPASESLPDQSRPTK